MLELVATGCTVGQTQRREREMMEERERGTERERERHERTEPEREREEEERKGGEKVTQKFSPTLITNLVSYQINHHPQ
jgi:hypothetical protein